LRADSGARCVPARRLVGGELALDVVDEPCVTRELAGLARPPPEMQDLFAALRDDPIQTSRFSA
jgi:hypothetical protein